MPKRLIAAVSLWTTAITVMAVGIVLNVSAVRGSAILVGLIACVPSGWLVVEHVVHLEAISVTRAISEAIGHAQAEEAIRRLHR